MKKIVVASILLLVGIFLSQEAHSAWTQPKGHSYNQLTLSYYKTTQRYSSMNVDTSGEVVDRSSRIWKTDTEEFNSTKITYYGEYGITDKLTVFTSIPYDWQRSNDTMRFAGEDGPSGVGDINLGVRHGLIDNILGSGILMSAQAEVKIPEAYDYGDPVRDLSLGDGQYDLTLAILFGRGLGKGYAWMNAGYKFRFENTENEPVTFKPSDQIKVSIGGGYAVTSWLSIRGLVDWTKSVGDAQVSNELLVANFPAGGMSTDDDHILIKDTLGLEPDALSVGIDLAFNVSFINLLKETFPSKEIVLSYNREVDGFGDFRTKDFALGETFSVAFVFPMEGLFPVNLVHK